MNNHIHKNNIEQHNSKYRIMYHFVTGETAPEILVLSSEAKVPGQICQYLKSFQIASIKFMYSHLAKQEFCILNDEKGLGKSVSIVVLLGAVASNKKCLIVTENDENAIADWQFHFDTLTNLAVTLISNDNKDLNDTLYNIYLAKWSTLRSIGDLSKLSFDYIIVDNRGQMFRNNFCTSMLLKNYERKVNILLSSVDVTSDTKLLYNVLRLGGRLDPQYKNYKLFEEKFKLPDAKEIIKKNLDMDTYFQKRAALSDYCKHFRLRRYHHQLENSLPLVEPEHYKINLELWRNSKQNLNSTSVDSVEYVPAVLSEPAEEPKDLADVDNPFDEGYRSPRQDTVLNEEVIQIIDRLGTDEDQDFVSEDVDMSPLIFVTDSESDSDIERISVVSEKSNSNDIVIVSSESKELEESEPSCDQSNTQKIKANPKKRKNIAASAENRNLRSQQVEMKGRTRQIKMNLRQQINNNNKNFKSDLKKGAKEKAVKRIPKNEKTTKIRDKIETENTATALKSSELTEAENSKEEASSRYKATTKESFGVQTKEIEIQTPKRSLRTENHVDNYCDQSKLTRSAKALKAQRAHSDEAAKQRRARVTKLEQENVKQSVASASTTLRERSENKSGRQSAGAENGSRDATARKDDTKQKPEGSSQQNANESPITPKATVQNIKARATTPSIQQRRSRLSAAQRTPSNTKQTRFMERMTRSSGSLKNKYMRTALALDIDMKPYSNKHHAQKKTKAKIRTSTSPKEFKNKATERNKSKQDELATTNTDAKLNAGKNTNADYVPQVKASKNKNSSSKAGKSPGYRQASQISVISTSSSEYEDIQCGQKFSLELLGSDQSLRCNNANNHGGDYRRSCGFVVPLTPPSIQISPSTPAILSSLALFPVNSDIFATPAPVSAVARKAKTSKADVIVVNSSQDESSVSSEPSQTSGTSRRTRALKHNRSLVAAKKTSNDSSATRRAPSSSFGDLLENQKMMDRSKSNKSPDLFSSCSDAFNIESALNGQQEKNNFEGFKLFGSEVKQFQQLHAENTKGNQGRKSERSCLEILEKMFEPRAKHTQEKQGQQKSQKSQQKGTPGRKATQKSKSTPILPTLPTTAKATQTQTETSNELQQASVGRLNVIDDDNIFEITNNAAFGSTMRINSNGDVSPVATQNQQQQQSKTTPNGQHNKITNYLTPTACISKEPEDHTSPNKQQLSGIPPTRRLSKSPKSNKSTTQSTKLTKWFPRNSNTNGDANCAAGKGNAESNARHIKTNATREAKKKTSGDVETVDTQKSTRSTVKRRRLDLSLKN